MHVRADIVRVVRTDIQRVRRRPVVIVNVVRHRELVINAVRRLISIVVAARVTHPEAERHVAESIRVVTVVRSINGVVVLVHIAGTVTNMRVV